MSESQATWEERYQRNEINWDQGHAALALQELLAEKVLPPGPALVPGCGTGYDVLALAQAGHRATGLDLAPTAKARFEALRASTSLTEEQARVELGDFFTTLFPERFSLIWDYTFFCAIDRSLRAAWERRMHELLDDRGELVTLLYPVESPETRPDEMGPPFRIDLDVFEAMMQERWRRVSLKAVTVSPEARRGREWIARWSKR